MQTFLPFPDFGRSAAALDPSRLGKQRVESLQILRALVIPDYGWQSHPAVRMWMGHVPALALYGVAMADEWIRRGSRDSTRANILEFAPGIARGEHVCMPPWFGEPELHRSHRSNLIRKDPGFYGARFPEDTEGLEYVWPEPERTVLPAEPGPGRVWILRMPVAEGELDPGRPAHISLPRNAPGSRRSPKRQRQVHAFVSGLAEGETVAVPLDQGGRFVQTTVTGPAREPEPGTLTRPVQVEGVRDRASFGYPALLQDPRLFFAVPGP